MRAIIIRIAKYIVSVIGLASVGVLLGFYVRLQSSPSWFEYLSGDKKFAASFPTSPLEEVAPSRPPLSGDQHILTSTNERNAYQVAYLPVPKDTAYPEDAFIAATTAQFPGRLTVLGPGLLKLELEAGGTINFKIIRAGDRLYRLSVSHPPGEAENRDIDYFFQRFDVR
jgi:hypothetical protein